MLIVGVTVFVGVFVGVSVGVTEDVIVGVIVFVGVFVGVSVGVTEDVIVGVTVFVGVFVGVSVGVFEVFECLGLDGDCGVVEKHVAVGADANQILPHIRPAVWLAQRFQMVCLQIKLTL